MSISSTMAAQARPWNRADVFRKHGISEWAFYRWRSRYGGMQVPEAKRLKQLEDENARLKRVPADQVLANQALREVLQKWVPVALKRRWLAR